MAKSLPQVFSNIAPEQYSRLIEKAKAAGIDLSGNIGTVTKFGVEVSWHYSPEKQELVLAMPPHPVLRQSQRTSTQDSSRS